MKSNNDEIDKLLAEKQWQVHVCRELVLAHDQK